MLKKAGVQGPPVVRGEYTRYAGYVRYAGCVTQHFKLSPRSHCQHFFILTQTPLTPTLSLALLSIIF